MPKIDSHPALDELWKIAALVSTVIGLVLLFLLATQSAPSSLVIVLTSAFPIALAFFLGALLASPKEQTERSNSAPVKPKLDLLANSIAAAVMTHAKDGAIQYCTPYTEVLTGYQVDQILAFEGDFLEHLTLEEDLERYQRARSIALLGEEMLVRYRVTHHRGFPLWLETRLVPVESSDSGNPAIMSVSIDVSDTLNYQRLIEEQNKDLSDFASMVSHDLKGPVFTIKGMVAALKEDCADRLEQQSIELLDFISDAAKRLEQLIESVIEYSAISTKELEEDEVQLSPLIKSVVQDMSELVKQKNAVVNFPNELPSIHGPRVRLYQVFSNLIGNAIKYSSSDRRPQVTVRDASKPRGPLIIEVEDNGVGIPEDKFDFIFRPFQRLDGTGVEGSGIGLACVSKIVERLGGTISLKSKVGKGSCFILEFPRVGLN